MTERLTRRQATIIGAYTGITAGPFSDLHAYAEEKMGFPILTHQFPSIADALMDAAREDFMTIVFKDTP